MYTVEFRNLPNGTERCKVETIEEAIDVMIERFRHYREGEIDICHVWEKDSKLTFYCLYDYRDVGGMKLSFSGNAGNSKNYMFKIEETNFLDALELIKDLSNLYKKNNK